MAKLHLALRSKVVPVMDISSIFQIVAKLFVLDSSVAPTVKVLDRSQTVVKDISLGLEV